MCRHGRNRAAYRPNQRARLSHTLSVSPPSHIRVSEVSRTELSGKKSRRTNVLEPEESQQISRLQKTRRQVVIAIELDIVERRRQPIPARHSGSFRAANVRARRHYHVSMAHGFADQHDFQLDGRSYRQLPRTKKIDACGTNVTHDQSSRIFVAHAADVAQQ